MSVEFVPAINPNVPTMHVRVVDNASGRTLFACTGLACDVAKLPAPVTLRSANQSGLSVSYQWITAGDDIGLTYGMRATWRAVCGVGGQDKVSGDNLSVVIADTRFANNSAPAGNGGGVALVAVEKYAQRRLSAVAITDAVFEANEAGGSGGGLYAPSRLNVTAERVDGTRNRALGGQGGCAFFGNLSVVAVSDSSCDLNAAGGDGGGIGVGAGASLQLSSTRLVGNAAATGGALRLGPDVRASVVGCNISLNAARATGGGCALDPGVDLLLTDATAVSGNAAASGGGGFVLLGRASLTVTGGAVLARNSAFLGGMLAFADARAAQSSLSLSGIEITNNTATAGALYGVLADSVPFAVPSCADCSVTLAEPLSYGREAATPPVRYDVNVTSLGRNGDVHPGDPISIGLSARPPCLCPLPVSLLRPAACLILSHVSVVHHRRILAGQQSCFSPLLFRRDIRCV